jgi:histidine triad (HIT) family protein
MSDCLFCKMVAGEIKPDVVYEDQEVLAFRDINPQAPTHVLVIPKKHISTTNDIGPGDAQLIGKLYLAAQQVAVDEGIAARGYRTVINCLEEAGQAVFHLHLHLLGGRAMRWPPG